MYSDLERSVFNVSYAFDICLNFVPEVGLEFTSGCHCFASLKYAAFTSSLVLVSETPSTVNKLSSFAMFLTTMLPRKCWKGAIGLKSTIGKGYVAWEHSSIEHCDALQLLPGCMSRFHLVPWAISKISGRSIALVAVPAQSKLASTVPTAYFADAFEQRCSDIQDANAVQLYYDLLRRAPKWADGLMHMRNRTCNYLFGLKDIGTFSEITLTKPLDEYRAGERLGVFTVVSISEDEFVFEDRDKHLNVQLSLLKRSDTGSVVISTVVHVNNWIGKLYMFFVGPAHKFIAPMMLFAFPVVQHAKVGDRG